MKLTNTYLTWVIRYVPNSTRGEFINIGVLVGSDHDDWAIRHVSNFKRANQLGGDAEKLVPIIRALKERLPNSRPVSLSPQLAMPLGEVEPLSVADIASMRVHKQNVLQFSDPRPSFGESAEAVANLLYDHMVLEFSSESFQKVLPRLRGEYEDALRETVPDELDWAKHVEVSFGYRSEAFDFAIHGDTAVEQITQAFNFANKDFRRMRDAVDALTLRFDEIRRSGASVSLKGQVLPFEADRPLYIVHNEPKGKQQADIYKTAQRAWSDLGVIRLPEEELIENPLRAIAA